ncbi:MAG: VanZ family protein [Cyanothece sp. SIO1E1]|nr:VanZ family protein [Cyanothece sp. SIO1E1]
MKLSTILAAVWTALILILCSIPGNELPSVQIVSLDKFIHAGLFAVFAILWLRDRPKSPQRIKWVIIGGIAYGILTEFYQDWFTVGRSADPLDAVANTIGLVLGIGLDWLRR